MSVTTPAITSLSATELVQAIAGGHLTATDAVNAHIARIEAVNPDLNAVVLPRFDEAREQARRADQLPPDQRGPLHGLPVTVKECYDLDGTPSTVGVPARATHRAKEDAPVVARLRRAGAIILGKTKVSQLLLYTESDNPVYGRTNNPWNLERAAGGSSGGEAAIVASQGSALGLGTDVGGSVRIPAHCCGITSLKPTPGRLSVTGTVDVVGHIASKGVPDSGGLLARAVADIQLALDVLSPPAVVPPPVESLRIGVYDDDGYFPASAAIRRAVHEAGSALGERGCHVVAFTPPAVPEGLAIFYGLFGADGGAAWRELLAGGDVDPRMKDLVMLARAPNVARPLIAGALRLAGQPRVASTVRVAGHASEARAADLLRRRDEYRARFAAAMARARVDVLICPPCAVPAFRHGSTRDLGPASASYTLLYNLLAYPAGVVTTTTVRPDEQTGRPRSRERMLEAARRVDEGSAGLPVGVQVVAAPHREEHVLGVMAALETTSTWRPPAH